MWGMIAGLAASAAASALSSSLSKKGSGTSKSKVKRDIPNPTPEETSLLNSLMGIVNNDEGYKTYDPLINTLKTPYSSQKESPALFDLLMRGWGTPPMPYGGSAGYGYGRGRPYPGGGGMYKHRGLGRRMLSIGTGGMSRGFDGAYGRYGIPFGGGLPPIPGMDVNGLYEDITKGW